MQLDSDFTRINHQDVFLIIEIGYLPFFFFTYTYLTQPFNFLSPLTLGFLVDRLLLFCG